MIPDRVDGAANGRDVVGVGEHRVFLFGYPRAGKFARQVGEVGNLDAGDVVEIFGIVAVAAEAVGDVADAIRDIADLLMLALPLIGNTGAAVLLRAAFADAGNEHRLSGFEARGFEIVELG